MRARRLVLAVLGIAFASLVLACPSALAVKRYVPAGSFGTEGSGNGQFKSPTAVAVNDSLVEPTAGDVYVLDTGNQRVERFAFNPVTKADEYAGQLDGGGTPAKSFSFGLSRSSQGIAVDNSGDPVDPSAGDVYVADNGHEVIDRFSATGEYLSQLVGTCAEPGTCPGKAIAFGELYGVTVDPSGDLWVAYKEKNEQFVELGEFSPTGAFLKKIITKEGGHPGLAVDSSHVYAICCSGEGVSKFDSVTGEEIAKIETASFRGQGVRAFAIDPSNGDLLLDDNEVGSVIPSVIVLHGPAGEPYSKPLQEFPAEPPFLEESFGIAVNGAGTVYVSQRGVNNVESFKPLTFPTVSTESGSHVTETSETLHGTVDPEGVAVTECIFEYGTETSYGHSVPCETTPTGSGPVAVSAAISGLEPRTTYHFRLLATNANGTTTGEDATFYTLNKPTIEGESSSSVGSTIATVRARVNPSGAPTGYSVEYGTSEQYGSSSPEASVGAGVQGDAVQVQLTGLQPGALYHFRFVARNVLGTTTGAGMTFTTTQSVAASPSTLPDNRAYELVSGATGSQSAYDPGIGQGFDIPEDLPSELGSFRAAAGGNSVAYLGEPSVEGGNGAFGKGQANQWLATRAPAGWMAQDITPLGSDSTANYNYFSADLGTGVLAASTPVPALPAGPPNCNVLYSRSSGDGSYHSLFTATNTPGNCGIPLPAGESANGSHLLFYTSAALTPGSVTGDVKENVNDKKENLYDSVGGRTYLVNVLPDGSAESPANGWFGGPPYGQEEKLADLNHVVSANGSRVFWSSGVFHGENNSFTPVALYVRKNDTQPQSPVGPRDECTVVGDACTVQVDAGEAGCLAEGKCVSGGGEFWGASSDGSRVFFTDCAKLTADSTAVPNIAGCVPEEERGRTLPHGNDLYEYNVDTGKLTDLTVDRGSDPLGADVQGVVGSSEDGSYVYFVAGGALAPGATSRRCEPVGGSGSEEEEKQQEEEGLLPAHHGCNLYVRHDGETVFIGTLLWPDNNLQKTSNATGSRGDWRGSLGERTAHVTPDGQALVFTSVRRLTGYDSAGSREAFVYDAHSGRIACASCDPSGAPPTPPTSGSAIGLRENGAYLPTSAQVQASPFMERPISSDGGRVFFETFQPLVARDTNGLQDVYEWERNGVGSCSASVGAGETGCIYLLSGGDSSDNAYLIDADASGANVFFTSRNKLATQASSEKVAVFDARVDGGFPEASLACTGSGCQGVPPAPPIFATPSSTTFAGVGNFSPPASPAAKPRSKRTARCARGSVKKRGRCVRRKAGRAKKPAKRSNKGGKR